MIPLKWKLYGIIAVAFVLGALGIRAQWIAGAEMRMRVKVAEKRVKAIQEAQEVRNEVEALDTDTLKQRATRWVRNPDR